MPSQIQPARARAVGTPSPTEFAVMVTVDPALIKADTITVGMAYKDAPNYFDKTLVALGYGEYIYTYDENTQGAVNFFFAKDKDADAANAPFRGGWKRFGNHRWCPILEGLAFIEDVTFPIATNVVKNGGQGIATSPRNYVREIFIQEVNEGSRFWLDEMFGPRQYNIGRYPVPQPGSISYQLPGFSPGGFPECLHDDIEIPAFSSGTQTYIGGTESSSDGRIPGQFFPRTNFRARRPYVLSADQVQRDGGWYMQRLRVFPPRQPRTTVQ